MAEFEVPEPILNSPFKEPEAYWEIVEGQEPKKIAGRRDAGYYYRDPNEPVSDEDDSVKGSWQPLPLVNELRGRMKKWRDEDYPGCSRISGELLRYWRREGRKDRLFFAQLEAAETIIFLKEARQDFLQGVLVPLDELSEDRIREGFKAFQRYACKMATGSGKTTVMGMLAAWSILNKVNDRSDATYSDTVLIVCPNVTIKNRLQELNPLLGDASLYRTRDLVPKHLMSDLTKGRVIVTNWHVFEPQAIQTGGVSAKVSKIGREIRSVESITIGEKTTTARGYRYLTLEELTKQVNAGLIVVKEEEKDKFGNLKKVKVESVKYVESDTALINRVLGKEVGSKQNILVFNDEAHHAYRIRRAEPDEGEENTLGEEEEAEEFFKEATVWIDGLDRVNKLRTINFCVDLSATPYFLSRVGQDTNRPFPWVVSDFGLTDAIESGLVKIPQLAVRDTTGADIPGYFNIWRWILPQLTTAERGGKKGNPQPEAILKWANHPIAMLGGDWEQKRQEWTVDPDEDRPPVFIIVCKNTRIAKVIYEWIAEDNPPHGIPPARLPELQNRDGKINTIRVDTKVIAETDTGESKSDEFKWMRIQLDTVGRMIWPQDSQGRPLYPEGFEELAKKLNRPLHPPGRDVRCIVSVGMLTEGWDCRTVTHIIGLRPFMSQLLCEQVVGRGLRRQSYELGADDKLTEEVAKILGVPFEVIPFKKNTSGPGAPKEKRHHVTAMPSRASYEIKFPRVTGYRQAIRNRVAVDWDHIAPLRLDPFDIPPEVQMKALVISNSGKPTLSGPGKLSDVDLKSFRAGARFQELVFDLAAHLTREYVKQDKCEVPPHVLFPQVALITERYLKEKVRPVKPAEILDVFLAPYYGWVLEMLIQAIKPDTTQGEAPELPRCEENRGPGTTADVDFRTSRDVREVIHSHVNYVVADTQKWEQAAAYIIDTHPCTEAFVKNAGLGFAIPYLHNGQSRDYEPDFIIRLKGPADHYLILETKGFDELTEIKVQAAQRWVAAVNADGHFGKWQYAMARKLEDVRNIIEESAAP